MRYKTYDDRVMFAPITTAARITGLSSLYIRRGVISGTIPHIRVGSDYRVNMPLWLQQLNAESNAATRL